jgi:hypothetical protein
MLTQPLVETVNSDDEEEHIKGRIWIVGIQNRIHILQRVLELDFCL